MCECPGLSLLKSLGGVGRGRGWGAGRKEGVAGIFVGMRKKSKGHIITWKVNIVHCSFLNLPSPSALPENFAISFVEMALKIPEGSTDVQTRVPGLLT